MMTKPFEIFSDWGYKQLLTTQLLFQNCRKYWLIGQCKSGTQQLHVYEAAQRSSWTSDCASSDQTATRMQPEGRFPSGKFAVASRVQATVSPPPQKRAADLGASSIFLCVAKNVICVRFGPLFIATWDSSIDFHLSFCRTPTSSDAERFLITTTSNDYYGNCTCF